jgi:hypothetical protein
LIKATENALLYFEGVPEVIVPDNSERGRNHLSPFGKPGVS